MAIWIDVGRFDGTEDSLSLKSSMLVANSQTYVYMFLPTTSIHGGSITYFLVE